MIERNVSVTKIRLSDGSAMEVTLLDGITPDDILVQGMKAEGYRVITKKDVFPAVERDMRDYLIRIGVQT
jgi:hypothetical protein